MDSSGKKVLGRHPSKARALKQLQAIEISKHETNESTTMGFSRFIQEDLMTLEYHNELNPKFWKDFELKPEVREKMLQIGKEWAKWANIPENAIKDYVFVGGNANFNYTIKSDIDIHLLIDTNEIADCPDFIEDYFEDKKDLWASKHDIKLYGQPVEIYAQNYEDIIPEGQGVYSLVKNEWLSFPKYQEDVNLNKIPEASQAIELKKTIDNLIKNNVDDRAMKAFKEQIKTMRNKSIEKQGEFGSGNLLFKELRNLGYLDKINQYIYSKQDERLSL